MPTKSPSKRKPLATVLSSKVSYKGKVFSVTTDKVTEPGGVTSTRDVIRHNGSVVILAPLAAAKRELIEETGFRARHWSRLVRYYASPGFLAETMQVFLAEDIRAGIAQPEEDEKISLHHIPLSELLHQIETGKILDGKTITSVLFFAHYIKEKSK
jgi:ADP-ribose pyrophosphatase